MRTTRSATESRARSVSSSEQISCSVRTAWSASFSGGGSPASSCGGELGVHGVQVVAQRGPGHRLPAVVARQRQDPRDQQRQPEPLADLEVRRARPRSGRGRRGRRSRPSPGSCTPAGTPPPGRRGPRARPSSTSASRRGSKASSSRPTISVGSSAITFSTTTSKVSTTDSVSSAMRRRVQQPAGGTLDQGADLQPHLGLHRRRRAGCRRTRSGAAGCRRRRSRGPRSWPGQLGRGRVGLPGQPVEVGDAGVVDQLVDDLGDHDLAAQLVLLHLAAVALAHLAGK